MKTRVSLGLVLLGAVIWISACASTNKYSTNTTKNVVFDKGGYVIPGTEISNEDQAAMTRILGQYDKSLYRIGSYENGKLTKTHGTMTDIITDKKLASQMAANIRKPGFTSVVGIITNPLSGTNALHPKKPKLVQSLKPILEKYRAQ